MKKLYSSVVFFMLSDCHWGFRTEVLHSTTRYYRSYEYMTLLSYNSKVEDTTLPPPCSELISALEELQMNNTLQPVSDLGYYGWTPQGSYRPLTSVTKEDIESSIDLSRTPGTLLDLEPLNKTLPKRFLQLEPDCVENRYPHGQTSIASIYVAKQAKGVDLNKVDFMFGSYSLYLLANGHTDVPHEGERCIIARVPSTNIILLTRYQEYVQDYSRAGHQFERYLLTGSMYPSNDHSDGPVHLQLMKVGSATALIAGEVDTVDADGYSTEVKLSSPYTVRMMFQMISSASVNLCRGQSRTKRNKIRLKRIDIWSLKSFSSRTKKRARRWMTRNIDRRLSWIQRAVKRNLKHGEVKEIIFQNKPNQHGFYPIDIVPCNITIDKIFPNASVVEALLKG